MRGLLILLSKLTILHSNEGDYGARARKGSNHTIRDYSTLSAKRREELRGGIPLLPPLGRIFAYFLGETRK